MRRSSVFTIADDPDGRCNELLSRAGPRGLGALSLIVTTNVAGWFASLGCLARPGPWPSEPRSAGPVDFCHSRYART
jgi:hypothetical protein